MTSGSASSTSAGCCIVGQMCPVELPNWRLDSICDCAEPSRVVVVARPFVKLVVAAYLDSFVPIFCSSGDAGAAYLVRLGSRGKVGKYTSFPHHQMSVAVSAYLSVCRLCSVTRTKQPNTNKAAADTAIARRRGDSSISRLFADPWRWETVSVTQ